MAGIVGGVTYRTGSTYKSYNSAGQLTRTRTTKRTGGTKTTTVTTYDTSGEPVYKDSTGRTLSPFEVAALSSTSGPMTTATGTTEYVTIKQEPTITTTNTSSSQTSTAPATVTPQEQRIMNLQKRETAYKQNIEDYRKALNLNVNQKDSFFKKTVKLTAGTVASIPFAAGGVVLAGEKIAATSEGLIRNRRETVAELKRTAASPEFKKTFDIRTPEGASTFITAGVFAGVAATAQTYATKSSISASKSRTVTYKGTGGGSRSITQGGTVIKTGKGSYGVRTDTTTSLRGDIGGGKIGSSTTRYTIAKINNRGVVTPKATATSKTIIKSNTAGGVTNVRGDTLTGIKTTSGKTYSIQSTTGTKVIGSGGVSKVVSASKVTSPSTAKAYSYNPRYTSQVAEVGYTRTIGSVNAGGTTGVISDYFGLGIKGTSAFKTGSFTVVKGTGVSSGGSSSTGTVLVTQQPTVTTTAGVSQQIVKSVVAADFKPVVPVLEKPSTVTVKTASVPRQTVKSAGVTTNSLFDYRPRTSPQTVLKPTATAITEIRGASSVVSGGSGRSSSRSVTKPVIDVVTISDTSSIVDSITSSDTRSVVKNDTRSIVEQTPKNNNYFTSFTPLTPSIVLAPKVVIPTFRFKSKVSAPKINKFSTGYNRRGYTPSAYALTLGITGKKSSSYRSGLGIRPIVKGGY